VGLVRRRKEGGGRGCGPDAGRGRDALSRELLTLRPQSPDTGRGADAGRKGIQDVRMSEGENVVLRLEA